MKEEYQKAWEAYEGYVLKDDENKAKEVLEYIRERIKANKEEIEKIIELNKRESSYEEIMKIVEEVLEEEEKYKAEKTIKRREDGFVSAIYHTSIGVIAVEAYEPKEVVRYMLKGIKTRNAIIISDVEYEERDEKNLILIIIQEALKKYGIGENLIQIMPYEECYYEECDKVIYTYSGKENEEKEKSTKMYIYLEDEELREEAERELEREVEQGKEIEIIEGEMDKAIEEINRETRKGAVIYTKDPKKGYKFINLVRSSNVYVNATLLNIEEVGKSKEELLMIKKIMYEMK